MKFWKLLSCLTPRAGDRKRIPLMAEEFFNLLLLLVSRIFISLSLSPPEETFGIGDFFPPFFSSLLCLHVPPKSVCMFFGVEKVFLVAHHRHHHHYYAPEIRPPEVCGIQEKRNGKGEGGNLSRAARLTPKARRIGATCQRGKSLSSSSEIIVAP